MKTYNGHRSWNAWNVSLWIDNDEGLYNAALYHLKTCKTVKRAARALLNELPSTTPDGAKYNMLCVKLALEDLA